MKAIIIRRHSLWARAIFFFFRTVKKLSPQQNLLFGFALYTIVGWLFLCLPWMHKQPVSFIDNLFTATSAISTTGLTTVSLSDSYTFAGQLLVLLLIQIGGVGYMTLGSFLILSKKSPLNLIRRKVLLTEFTIPQGFVLKDFIISVVLFTFIVEVAGAVLLFFSFTRLGIPFSEAVYSSIFHSISSFCTAGFGLFNNSFESFAYDPGINIILSVLSILGALGFIVVTDFWYWFRGHAKSITHTSKAILLTTFFLLAVGTIILYCGEPTIQSLNFEDRLYAAFFQCMTALTTVGFNTISIGNLSLPALLLLVFLMFVGASPSGTGGGLKSTTFTALLAILWNKLRGNPNVTFLGKILPTQRLYVATSSFILYSAILFTATCLLAVTEVFPLSDILFETASALGTVGLSTGITSSLTTAGKSILIFTMFIGRVGVLTIGMSILARRKTHQNSILKTDLAV
ncbi:Ktr system potassium uptake protein B [bioreactor metagenome]|uniref:Ktr system potassium uptake protein B n=1 Tax=bioreactor metagenome TaxID=1076179 RepID=A0A645AEH8_9ZZZZ